MAQKNKVNPRKNTHKPKQMHRAGGRKSDDELCALSDSQELSYYEKADGNWISAVLMYIDDSGLHKYLKPVLKTVIIVSILCFICYMIGWVFLL
ncbi:MAG: hypothetical protein HDS68_05540 [Bacteroidales bacterium]|nr:hypothetical protein [Bacteroidales bacterium]